MEMVYREIILETLEDLTQDEFERFKDILNKKPKNGKTIPTCKLEGADAIKVTDLLFAYHSIDCVQLFPNMLKDIPRKDLEEDFIKKVEAEKKSKDQIVESDGSPSERTSLDGLYQGTYCLSDLEICAAKNQNKLIKQLEDYIEPNRMSILKEKLAHSKLKNDFVFTAKQCYELHNNKELKEFQRKISSYQKSQNIPDKIHATLFSTIKNNKRKAMDQKWNKENKRTWQERPQKENKPISSSSAGSLAESGQKNQWNKLPANKGKESTPVSPNASYLGLDDEDEEKAECKVVHTKMGGDVSQNSEFPVHVLEESQSCLYENQVPKADNILSEKAIRELCKGMKVEKCKVGYTGVWAHGKYGCFVAENVMQFKLPSETEYNLLRIVHKNDLTQARRLKKNVEFELQFDMAVLGAPSFHAVSPQGDFFEVVRLNKSSFAEFEEFFKDVVHNIFLPILALYKMVKVEPLQMAFDKYCQ